ncbi:MAG: hypothetical protein AAFY66_12545, partial [Pseudomonadota bacterium]
RWRRFRRATLASGLAVAGLLADLSVARSSGLPAERDGDVYVELTQGRGIDARVDYLNQDDPAPKPDHNILAKADILTADSTEWTSRALHVLIALVFLGSALAAISYAAQRPARGVRTARDPERTPTPAIAASGKVPVQTLDAIDAIRDRALALSALAAAALGRIAGRNGSRLRQAWTLREALATIPESEPLHPQLAALVSSAEAARFGGRAIEEATYRQHRLAVAPLWETPS